MLKLAAEKREIFGKQLKAARAAGRLPAVIYGRKEKPRPLFVQVGDFKKVFAGAGESAIVNLETASGSNNVLIHDVARHPVTGDPIHVDFYVVEKDVVLETAVPIEFTGTAPAVKELGGTLIKVLHELRIEALPDDLPPALTVDLAPLSTLESQILVRDLILPSRIKVLHRSEEVIAAVTLAEEEPAEESTPPDLSAIEVEKRGKEEKDAAEAPPPADE